ncbi:permease [Amycolatopsis sp. SID8362]|uniref:permease n=1 Tax=Amycolatopsis sp. SID8362 TaxID=2690346 RepID=UPI00136EAF41|nr:permease [Amycolatopsis sp. SID8362]NBH08917.1 permease [Amycolatopsis sp. SID8362]NED45609.1 permease [Amycolatopsis sp. SID8362]
MIAGHFGLAAAVKAGRPAIPVWTLMLATAWLDVVFVPLYLSGIETVDGEGYGGGVIHADYTHSLVGALVLAALFGGVAAIKLGREAGLILAGVVFSHWLLDLVVHRADLPILPGNAGDLPTFGFGLWRLPAVSAVVELLMLAIGIGLYWRAAAKRDPKRARTLGLSAAAFGVATLAADLLGV